MAKKTNWLPNIRVDIPDLEQGTHGYSGEIVREFNSAVIKDAYPKVVEGFRVEVADATNRVLNVYSGVATDQDGQLINNAESAATSRSITLSGNATHYIEIEFVEVLGSTDSRAFWDPTYDNGLDTSGDVLADGREATQNVSTRKTHDWEIVSPPSTTGFEVSTTASSTRVPLAIVTVAGGVITAPTGTGPARTCLARTHLASAPTLAVRVLNSRLFPDSFTARLGPGTANQEDILVTANDRDNGILTLQGPGAVNNHNVGERVVNVTGGASVFIDERITMDDSGSITPGAGQGPIAGDAGDARIRLFQGDTEAGYSLSQDPSSDTGESDIQIKNLKEQVDFLASQVLEMKYGSGSRDLLGVTPPPSDFSNPSHYSRSGGIVNARSHTVSVGDGVSTWGDFNTTTSGSAQAAIQAAIDAVPVGGGIVYIKGGTYTITTTPLVIATSKVTIVGDPEATTITSTGSAVVFSVTIDEDVSFRDLSITSSGTALYAMDFTNSASVYMVNCLVSGLNASGGLSGSTFENTNFKASSGGFNAIAGSISTSVFNRCGVTNIIASAACRALLLGGGSHTTFNTCRFSVNTTATAIIELEVTCTYIAFNDCHITQASGVATALEFGSGVGSNIRFNACEVSAPAGFGIFYDGSDVQLIDCTIAVPASGSAVDFTDSCADVSVRGCKFTQAASAALTTGIAIRLNSVANVHINGCTFASCNRGIQLESAITYLTVEGCSFGGDTTRIGICTGYTTSDLVTDIRIANNYFYNIGSDDIAVGIHGKNNTSVLAYRWVIQGNSFYDINGAAGEAFGVFFESGTTVVDMVVDGNTFRTIENSINSRPTVDTGRSAAVYLAAAIASVISNNVIAGVNLGTAENEFFGIKVGIATGLTISGNMLRALGRVSTLKVDRSAGISVGGTAGELPSTSVAITGNTIYGLNGSNSHAGIFIGNDVVGVSVSGNSMKATGTSTRGIWVETGAALADNTYSVAISGNTFEGPFVQCLYYDLNVAFTSVSGIVSVTGNTGNGFINTGIRIQGLSTNVSTSVSISGNTMRSTVAETTGIGVEYVRYCSIVGNTILLTDGTAVVAYGIHLTDVNKYTCSSNSVTVLATGACRGIMSANNNDGSIVGNLVEIQGDAYAVAIAAGGLDNFVTANRVVVNGGGTWASGGPTVEAAVTFTSGGIFEEGANHVSV